MLYEVITGVDSSAIVSAMCGVRSAHEVQTFSIGFREKSYDELPMRNNFV